VKKPQDFCLSSNSRGGDRSHPRGDAPPAQNRPRPVPHRRRMKRPITALEDLQEQVANCGRWWKKCAQKTPSRAAKSRNSRKELRSTRELLIPQTAVRPSDELSRCCRRTEASPRPSPPSRQVRATLPLHAKYFPTGQSSSKNWKKQLSFFGSKVDEQYQTKVETAPSIMRDFLASC